MTPQKPSTADIREKYLSFFEGKGHLRLPSYSIVAPEDYDDTTSPKSTTMFTVAGMQPFKPQFLGARPEFPGHSGEYRRVTTAQKSLRIGDIENVGRTRRHLSLFEMLGNFSFGDYFKREAITWAWELLTRPEGFALDPARLYVTIYEDDEEAFDIWTREVGLPVDHILRFGADENFWPADAPLKGPNGPCGPCSEIFYDRGPNFGDDSWEDYAETRESARFLEIWNLVFPQYDRQAPQPDGTPTLADLPFKNIDTGMGLERVASILQDVPDFYSTDIFLPLIEQVVKHSGKPYEGEISVSHRVIAEHSRSISMTLADGVNFSNTERGYVVRKVLRHASRHAYLLGLREPVLYKLVPLVVEKMGDAYPELRENQGQIEVAIKSEEERFLKTLESGLERIKGGFLSSYGRLPLEQHIGRYETEFSIPGTNINTNIPSLAYSPGKAGEAFILPARNTAVLLRMGFTNEEINTYLKNVYKLAVRPEHRGSLPEADFQGAKALLQGSINDLVAFSGLEAFTLYDTYGFPLDLTREIAEEYGVSIDEAGFDKALSEQQERARAASKYGKAELFGAGAKILSLVEREHGPTEFVGYQDLGAEGRVLAIVQGGEGLDMLPAGSEAQVVLSRTPFYAEGGGEVGDQGWLTWDEGKGFVRNTHKTPQGLFLHDLIVEEGQLRTGDRVNGAVFPERQAIERHHTATHLLHAALRAVLGPGARQAGSLVTPERLRFDFTHAQALTGGQLAEVERLVSRWIQADFPVGYATMNIEQARAAGATALFGEKYGDTVRVVSVEGGIPYGGGEVMSKELCGGAHVTRTGEIGGFVIAAEEGLAAGVRRITALAGEAATGFVREQLNTLGGAAASLNSSPAQLEGRLTGLQAQLKEAQGQIAQLKRQVTQAQLGGGAARDTREIGGYQVATLRVTGLAGGELRAAADQLLEGSGADLAVVAGDAGLVVKASKNAVARGAHAGQLVGRLAAAGGGKGGGRPDMAQAGVQNPEAALGALEGAL